jgi:hypothetical protein
LDANLVAFADDPEAAKSSVANWVIIENPWNRSADDPRKTKDCRGSFVEEIGSFPGYGDGDGPIKMEVGPPLQDSALKTIGQLTSFPKQTTHRSEPTRQRARCKRTLNGRRDTELAAAVKEIGENAADQLRRSLALCFARGRQLHLPMCLVRR